MTWRCGGSGQFSHLMGASESVANWSPCTVAAVIRLTQTYGSQVPILASATSGGTHRAMLYLMNDSTNGLAYWDGSVFTQGDASVRVSTSEGWVVVSMTKDSGTVLPKFYKSTFSTGAFAISGSTASAGAATTAGAGGLWWSCYAPAWPTSMNGGDIAAVMYLPRVLSEGELPLLLKGDWWLHSPVYHREYRDNVPGPGTGFGSDRSKDATVTGFTASPLADPPGFRFSPLNRRR